eukprot:6117896-Pleurochrysis_carterae.AAC.1
MAYVRTDEWPTAKQRARKQARKPLPSQVAPSARPIEGSRSEAAGGGRAGEPTRPVGDIPIEALFAPGVYAGRVQAWSTRVDAP